MTGEHDEHGDGTEPSALEESIAPRDTRPDDRIDDPAPRHTPLWALLSRWLLALEAWLRSHGGRRLRGALWAFWGVVGLAGGILLVGPVINPPMTLDDITDSASSATDRWIARDFDVDYTIGRTDDGRLVADVVETIGALFPDDVDETGIVRVLPTQYQGHALSPTGIEATIDGEPADIRSSESSDQLTLTLGSSTGSRLDGDHEFVIRYQLHDLAYTSTDEATGVPVDLLAWDVFGPSWPQAFSALDVSITLPDDLDAQLVRQPRGHLAWTLLSAGSWLDPDNPSPPGTVTYGFTNDQNMPPHASAGFTLPFESGTFTMPPPTPLFLLQSFGPLLPLAFLAITLLLALAARAVAWSDERGRPWFVAQSEPPDGVSARLAAQILRTPRTRELASALADLRGGGGDGGGRGGRASRSRGRARRAPAGIPSDRLRAAARAAQRTGRIGDLLRAGIAYLRAPEHAAQLGRGLRRVPSGFVRDLFIAAPIALTLVQWGLVRQLSHQTTLAVVWWPAAFVLLSSAFALIILVIALSARPLTKTGALVKQHLRGIAVYASRTSLLDRTTLRDPVLPYAVLEVEPRDAGRRVLALIEAEPAVAGGNAGAGDGASSGWRTRDFLSWPRILVRVFAVLLVAGSITAAAVLPNPYPRSPDYSANSGDIPGTYWNHVDAFDAAASLSRDDTGRASLAVTETLTVDFSSEESSEVPQFARQWPAELDGQDLGLRIESVRLDGADAGYTTVREGDSLLLTTTFAQVLSGTHDIEIGYAVDSPVVAAHGSGLSSDATTVDRLRWVALLEDWDDSSSWEDPAPSPLTISLTVPDDLATTALAAGWITVDTDSAESPRQWEDSVLPFGTLADVVGDQGASESSSPSGGRTTYALDLHDDVDTGYPFELRVDDLGAMLDFPAGTFTGPDASALSAADLRGVLPMVVVVSLGVFALLIGLVSLLAAARRGSRRTRPGFLRDLAWWLGTGSAVSAVWLFVWATSDMPDDWQEFPPLALAGLAGIVGGVLSLVMTRGETAPPPRRP